MNAPRDTVTTREAKTRENDRTPPAGDAPAVSSQTRLHAPERSVAVWGPLLAVTVVTVTVLAILIIIGVWHHVARVRAEEQFAEETSQTVVNVQTVHRNPKAIDLVLPGSIEANQATMLYARSSGFLGKWNVDIGDNVTQGETLAVIETPDLDQQLRQAEGTLNQSQANYGIAQVTAQRWQQLFEQRVVSAQDNDTQQSNFKAATAALAAAQANVNQLKQLVAFNQIVAPFDGKITYRYLDIGALVTQGSGAAGTAIYDIAQTDPLRIYVYVPQSDAPLIHAGVTAKVLVRELPGQDFEATVARTAGAIDPASRTLLTELLIPNKDGRLLAGMYGEIQFTLLDQATAPVMVPANAFTFRPEGSQVVLVRGGKIHWQTILVGRDFGTELEALNGVQDGDQVVINPTDDLLEGMTVTTQAGQ
jgi:RND family efflux transporter MFP subunit